MVRLSLCVLMCICALPLTAQEQRFEPEKTWVFAVGILEFDAKAYGAFPKAGRRDAVLIETLVARGVKKDRIVFIKDDEAEKATLVAKFTDLCKQAGEGDQLLFYYAGHGVKDKQRTLCFVPNDAKGKGTKSLWPVTEMLDTLEGHFKGSRAFLTADCCHCGGMVSEAAKRKGKIEYGTLVSAHLNTISTPKWTFTNVLIDALGGSALADRDGDGQTTFAETAQYAEIEMAFFEHQLAVSGVANGFKTGCVLAKAEKKSHARLGECLEADWDGKWYRAKVLKTREGKGGDEFFVTWVGYKESENAWVSEAKCRKWKPDETAPGTECLVESHGKDYKAKVLESKLGLLLVKYDGYPDEDNEWVAASRVKITRNK